MFYYPYYYFPHNYLAAIQPAVAGKARSTLCSPTRLHGLSALPRTELGYELWDAAKSIIAVAISGRISSDDNCQGVCFWFTDCAQAR